MGLSTVETFPRLRARTESAGVIVTPQMEETVLLANCDFNSLVAGRPAENSPLKHKERRAAVAF